jgi:hypothetical protein
MRWFFTDTQTSINYKGLKKDFSKMSKYYWPLMFCMFKKSNYICSRVQKEIKIF